MIVSRWILLKMANVSDKSCREYQNTHFTFSNSSPKSCRLWDNVEEYSIDRQTKGNNIIQRKRFACWITKVTDTDSEYVIFIASPQQQWLRQRVSILRYTYIACLDLLFALQILSFDLHHYKISIWNKCSNAHNFNRTLLHQTASTSQYSTAHKAVRLTLNVLRSDVLPSIPLRPMSTSS